MADSYFKRKGFVPTKRGNVSTSIRQTGKFTSICPSSAVVMQRRVNLTQISTLPPESENSVLPRLKINLRKKKAS